jgi:hypothetical protein
MMMLLGDVTDEARIATRWQIRVIRKLQLIDI